MGTIRCQCCFTFFLDSIVTKQLPKDILSFGLTQNTLLSYIKQNRVLKFGIHVNNRMKRKGRCSSLASYMPWDLPCLARVSSASATTSVQLTRLCRCYCKIFFFTVFTDNSAYVDYWQQILVCV
jgi:hypothetical protein